MLAKVEMRRDSLGHRGFRDVVHNVHKNIYAKDAGTGRG
jgi:hypothetical protein